MSDVDRQACRHCGLWSADPTGHSRCRQAHRLQLLSMFVGSIWFAFELALLVGVILLVEGGRERLAFALGVGLILFSYLEGRLRK